MPLAPSKGIEPMRRTLVAIIAAGCFGGIIGSLATAATQSTASSSAIAAAVQKVSDQRAEKLLVLVNSRLATVQSGLSTLEGTTDEGLSRINNAVETGNRELRQICFRDSRTASELPGC